MKTIEIIYLFICNFGDKLIMQRYMRFQNSYNETNSSNETEYYKSTCNSM